MAEQTVPLTAGQTSSAITVLPRKLLGVETNLPVSIKSKGGATIAQLGISDAKLVIPPNDTITITAGPAGATVILDKES